MSDSKQTESINAEALTKLQESAAAGPVVMLNLLRFKPEGGAESYGAYGTAVGPLLEQAGGEVIYAGQPNELVIGSDRWDLMLLVRYPTRGAFLQMITSAEYLEISNLRDAALDDSVLYATDPLG